VSGRPPGVHRRPFVRARHGRERRVLPSNRTDDPEGGGDFATAQLGDGLTLALGTYELTHGYDPTWREPSGAGTNALQFTLASRDAVDAMHDDLVRAGYASQLAPFDAFWGARYAEIRDPDGNVVGFHSPRDDARAPRRRRESEGDDLSPG
jgi:hypothetical protein